MAPAAAATTKEQTPCRMGRPQQVGAILEDPRLTALNFIRQDKNYLDELWLKYWAQGGSAGSVEFEAYLHGLTQRDSYDLQILRWAIDDISSAAHPR
jgi:hypothetical protein